MFGRKVFRTKLNEAPAQVMVEIVQLKFWDVATL